MKTLFLTITTLFVGLFTIASCDINNPKPDKVKESKTTQGNENKENKTEDKEKEKEKENTEDKVEDKDKEKEPSSDGTTSNGEQPSNDGTTSNGEQPSNDGTTSNEVGTGESGTNESGSSESGITSDGRRTPEETARLLAFNTKRVKIRERLEKDSKLDKSPEGIELARTIAANWDMRYKTDLMGRPVDEFYLVIGTIERNKMRATDALDYGWQRINEERYN